MRIETLRRRETSSQVIRAASRASSLVPHGEARRTAASSTTAMQLAGVVGVAQQDLLAAQADSHELVDLARRFSAG